MKKKEEKIYFQIEYEYGSGFVGFQPNWLYNRFILIGMLQWIYGQDWARLNIEGIFIYHFSGWETGMQRRTLF